jgi:integrase
MWLSRRTTETKRDRQSAQALDDAVDYKLLDANPARGKRRRMKVGKPTRTFLEPDMVMDLLDEAGEWEASLPPHQRYGRRALLALMVTSGGPRISEVTAADRGELDIPGGRWHIPESKTDAGARDVELTAFALTSCARTSPPASRVPGSRCSRPGPAVGWTRATSATDSSPSASSG